jgi:hypothetical protein
MPMRAGPTIPTYLIFLFYSPILSVGDAYARGLHYDATLSLTLDSEACRFVEHF